MNERSVHMNTIYFDMDGTIADLYGVDNWLGKLRKEDVSPYVDAKPLLPLNQLARLLNTLQKKGFRLGIITWLAKNSSKDYEQNTATAKLEWLRKHLKSVEWDEIHCQSYGTPKENVLRNTNDILFDDNDDIREAWNQSNGTAYDEKDIIKVLKGLNSGRQ